MILEKIGPQGLICPNPGAIYMYEAWPGKSCTLLIFSLFDVILPFNLSNTFRNSNAVKRGA